MLTELPEPEIEILPLGQILPPPIPPVVGRRNKKKKQVKKPPKQRLTTINEEEGEDEPVHVPKRNKGKRLSEPKIIKKKPKKKKKKKKKTQSQSQPPHEAVPEMSPAEELKVLKKRLKHIQSFEGNPDSYACYSPEDRALVEEGQDLSRIVAFYDTAVINGRINYLQYLLSKEKS